MHFRHIFCLQTTHCWWWWWIVFVVWLTDERCLALFPAGTIVRDPHHRESPTRRAGFEPAQNLSSGLVEWSCAVVITTTPRRSDKQHFPPWILWCGDKVHTKSYQPNRCRKVGNKPPRLNFFNNQTWQGQSVMLSLDLPIYFFIYDQTLFNFSNIQLE